MKKAHFLILSALLFWGATSSFHVCKQEPTIGINQLPEEIDLIEYGLPDRPPKPRSVVTPVIRAWYDPTFYTVTLELSEQVGWLTVSVEDITGTLLLQQMVDGDEYRATINMFSFEEGFYKLIVMGGDIALSGWFEVLE